MCRDNPSQYLLTRSGDLERYVRMEIKAVLEARESYPNELEA